MHIAPPQSIEYKFKAEVALKLRGSNIKEGIMTNIRPSLRF